MLLRFLALVAVVVLCAMHAPAPDPRIVAAMADAVPASAATLQPYPDGDWVCPMDKDVRRNAPGFCPRCGMKLVEGVRETVEFPIDLSLQPAVPRPGEDAVMTFGIVNPVTLRPVRDFEIVHEKLYHVFVVSQDMKFFLHTHPERTGDEDFHLRLRFPHAGMYRVLSDFFPSGATPQLISNTVMVPGTGFHLENAQLTPDLGPQNSENARVDLTIAPEHPVAGQKVAMYYRITPDQDLQPYLGAPAHMLAASEDLVDLIHNHPFAATDGQMQFNMTFPRPGVHRVWIQFQRAGVVNTAAFNVPVQAR